MDELSFISDGACRGYPTIWWYPEDNKKESRENSLRALKVCATCDCVRECLVYALKNETHGIWGGMREVEREIHRIEHHVQLSPRALTSQSTSVRRVARRLREEYKANG